MSKKKKSKRNKKDNKMLDNLNSHFNDAYGERIGTERVIQMNIADADREYTQIFSANKNLYRHIPSLLDGMVPGKRRLFYSMWEDSGKPTSTDRSTLKRIQFKKVMNAISATSRYHPHGPDGINGMINTEGAPWCTNVSCVETQGDYGNMRGDPPPAARYLDVKPSEYMIDCFFDKFDKYPIEMLPSYDGKSEEPVILPSKYPHILFNAQFDSIGKGLASNIPPFNMSDVLDACIKLLKNPNAKILIYPDLPTGCNIIDNGTFESIMETGKGKLEMEATTEIDYTNNTIHVSSLPFNSRSQTVINKIADLVSKGNFTEIIDIEDFTKESVVDMTIVLDKKAKPEKVLKKLLKKNVGLRTTKAVGICVIDDFVAYTYGVKQLLKEWIDFRIEMVRSMCLNDYQIMMSKEHMNNILLTVFNKDNIDITINIAKTSTSKSEMIDKLMKQFDITSLQATTISEMKVYNFNKDQYEKYKEDKEKISNRIKELEHILESDENIKEYIINELEEGKRKWGYPRKSRIIKKDETDIPDTDHLVGVSESGYIKKIDLKKNSNIGVIGDSNCITYVFNISNRDSILVFDSSGSVTKVPISEIPDVSFEDRGVELKRFFNTTGNIISVMEFPSENMIVEAGNDYSILLVTKRGFAKKVSISELVSITNKNKPAIKLADDDELASARIIPNTETIDVIVITNNGNGIRIHNNDIPSLSFSAKGVRIISLSENEDVVNTSLITGTKKFLFYITTSGRCKTTLMKYFPPMERKAESLNLISLQGDEKLLGVIEVNKLDSIVAIKKKSEPELIHVNTLTPTTRISSGDKIIKTPRGDMVIGFRLNE